MKRIILRSPAKLNLFLKVINKRSDGYHTLETLFERIDLHDRITLISNASGRIRVICRHPGVPTTRRNLAYQSARLIKEQYGRHEGVDIIIDKRIPVAAGLGGGSSNAAAVILGLNRLWKLSMTIPDMASLGKQLGSDVPFFIYGCRFAVGRNKGDVISPLRLKRKLWHVIIVPCTKVHSFQVYRAFKMKLTRLRPDVNMLNHALKRSGVSRLNGLFMNDLEAAIVRLHPQLLRIKNRIQRWGIMGITFSGSGPALFGVTESRREARRWATALRGRYSRVFVAHTA